jgi:hypothetical protein
MGLGLMAAHTHTRSRTRTPRGGTRARLGRVRVCQRRPAQRRSTCGSEREWSGGCFFNARLAPRSQPALIGVVSHPRGSRRLAAKRKFSGWGLQQRSNVQNHPTGVNVVDS